MLRLFGRRTHALLCAAADPLLAASPQERYTELRDSVRKVCQQFPNEYWRKMDAKKLYPTEFVSALTKKGFLSALIPEQYGGSGATVAEASVILEEINRSGGNPATCHAQMYIMGTLLRHGSQEQKQKYLPLIADGQLRLQAFGVTEPDAGSETTKIRTKAVKQSDGSYLVNGQKMWTSRAEHSDLMILLARTDTEEDPDETLKSKTKGLSVFLLDLRQLKGKGITIQPIPTMINHHTTQVFFDNVVVPGEALIGVEGNGFKYLLDGLNAERILIAAECIGDTYWFIDTATQYAKERNVFGRPIGQNQGIQFPLAQVYAKVSAADLMRFHAADRYDSGLVCGKEANMAKLLAADVSFEAANVAMQTLGGSAFSCEMDVERKFRETRLYQIAPISTNLVLSYLAEHVLGLPRSY
eukprot:TRINITY_DN25858_c0_g1_i1.p1 TRINITY_DN25858_c0_g1~~TRINITY_DN25858_c0_g1_i1.p1  ORF type:complete len:413 (+),score=58.20 TRINITY_DN25858_c0_g1_i1:34-1272(+)